MYVFSTYFRVCGGVSKNDFIMEMISSLTDCTIERSLEPDMSLLGTVYLAGLGAGRCSCFVCFELAILVTIE